MPNILYKEESYALMGACFEVRNELGTGFLEEVYHESLQLELSGRNIPFVSKPKLELSYKDQILKKKYEPDLVAYGKIIVELKAVSSLCDSHRSQVFNYLKATQFKLGLLVNFGSAGQLEYHRIVR